MCKKDKKLLALLVFQWRTDASHHPSTFLLTAFYSIIKKVFFSLSLFRSNDKEEVISQKCFF